MAKRPPNAGNFKKGNKQGAKSGRSKKSIILDAIRENALLGVDADATPEAAETAVFAFLSKAAFNPSNQQELDLSNTALTQLMKKGWADVKAQDECVKFTFTSKTMAGKSEQILKAVSLGKIPPSVGVNLLSAMTSMLKIKEITELEDRIKALEKDGE